MRCLCIIYTTCVLEAYVLVFVTMQHVHFFMPSNFVVQHNEPTLNKSNNIGKATTTTTAAASCIQSTCNINQLAKWFSIRLKKTVTWKTPIVSMTELTVFSFCCYSVCPLIFFFAVCKHVNDCNVLTLWIYIGFTEKKINGLSFDLLPRSQHISSHFISSHLVFKRLFL